MKVSERISKLAPSPTVALNTKAKKLASAGTKVYNFAVGEPDSDTPPSIVNECIQALKDGVTRYGPPGGTPALREAIVKKLREDNQLDFAADQIVCGIGAKEILFHLSLALLNEGDEVLIPAPYWVSYTTQVEAAGAKPIVVPMDPQTGRIDMAGLESSFSDKTSLVILNSPNNPGGYIFSENELAQLGDLLKSKDVWVIADEMYEYLSYTAPHKSLLTQVPELKEKFILVNGLSKGFAMTGFRVGYCAAPPAVAKLVKNLQSQSSTCIPGFIEKASVYALENRAQISSELNQAMLKKKELVDNLLSGDDNFKALPTEGAFYAFLDVSQKVKASSKLPSPTSMAFGEYLLEEYQVAMVPGEAFGAPGFLRLSYAASVEDLKEGISRFKKALNEI